MSLPAEVRETHSGVVLLLGDRAYKLKKPVDLGFLDFRTERARHLACLRELELNRRLAPDVYLDVLTITGSDGVVCDHVLVMRRMPDELRLSTLIARRADVREPLRELAQLLASFHRDAERGERITEQGMAAALRRRWQNNLAQTEGQCRVVLDPRMHRHIGELALAYVDGRAELLTERAGAGLIVDGHGDLLAEDVFCLPDGPRALDCIEFDDRLRWVDVLDDVSFLAMDLQFLGRPDLAEHFLACYLDAAGLSTVASLQHHYVAYRAFVRATVACIRASQGVPAAVSDAGALARLALHHLRAGEVRLVLVGGAPGTGKTSLAHGLAERLDAVVLSSDVVRRHLPAVPGEQRYTPAAKEAVYRRLLDEAAAALRHGRSVIADATWASQATRRLADQVAEATRSRLVSLECRAPVVVTAERARLRADRGEDASEAGAEVARRLAAERDPWPEAAVIDTSGSRQAALESAHEVCTAPPP